MLLRDIIQSWDLDDENGVMDITLANLRRMPVPHAVFLLNAYAAWQAELRTDMDFTDTSPTGREESETTRPPALVSFPSTGPAGENSA